MHPPSLMFSWFRRKPSQAANTNALKEQKQSLHDLERRLRQLQQDANERKQLAIDTNDDQEAIFQLKRSRMMQREVDQLQTQILNLQQSVLMLEQSKIANTTVNSLQQGIGEIKLIQPSVIEDTMDQLQECYDQQQELHDASSEVFGETTHDDVLLDDLKAMRGSSSVAKPRNGPAAQPLLLPQAPQHALPAVPAVPAKPQPASNAAQELLAMEALMS